MFERGYIFLAAMASFVELTERFEDEELEDAESYFADVLEEG